MHTSFLLLSQRMFLLLSSKLGLWIMREVPLREAVYLSDSLWPAHWSPQSCGSGCPYLPWETDFFLCWAQSGCWYIRFTPSESIPLSQPWSLPVVLPLPLHGAAAITVIMSFCVSRLSPRAAGICCSALLQGLQILQHTYRALHLHFVNTCSYWWGRSIILSPAPLLSDLLMFLHSATAVIEPQNGLGWKGPLKLSPLTRQGPGTFSIGPRCWEQPDLECFQGCVIHYISEQLLQGFTTLTVKTFFLISNLNQLSFSLNLLFLVLP